MSFQPFVHHVDLRLRFDLVGIGEQIIVMVVRSGWAVVVPAFDASSVSVPGDDELVDVEMVVFL
jgi:hypothetical protein